MLQHVNVHILRDSQAGMYMFHSLAVVTFVYYILKLLYTVIVTVNFANCVLLLL